jgi:hypothetical protein
MAATPKEKLLAHLKENGKDRSWTALSKLFNPKGGDDWSRTIARQNGFDPNTGKFSILQAVDATQYRADKKRHQRDRDFLAKRIISLQKEIEVYKDLEDYKPRINFIQEPSNAKRGEATAIVQWSDWHLDEEVKPGLVGGLNEYNQRVAQARSEKLFENTIKLTDTQRSSVDVQNMVLHFGGDFITNFLHPENEQTNTMGPMEAMEFAIDRLCTGISYLRKHGRFKNIIIVTNRGNHGRITDKMQYSNDYALNLETPIYCAVKREFRNDKNISWHINQGAISYFDVYGRTLRFLHGHQIRYKGGIGGLTIPLIKAILRWNETKKAFYTFICDKHTYSNPTPDSQVNGSLVGFNAMANELGCVFQPPLQSFTLLDSKRGVTIKAPIFCQ